MRANRWAVLSIALTTCAAVAACGSSGTASGPAASRRSPHYSWSRAAVAFDPGRKAVLAFGTTVLSAGSVRPSATTWQWTGDAWQPLAVTGAPPGRSQAMFGFDPGLRGLVLADGQAETETAASCAPAAGAETSCAATVSPVRDLSDAWLLSSDGWRQLETNGMPGVGWAATTDPSRGALIVVGSTLPPPQGSTGTWQHTAAGWTTLSSTTPEYGASLGYDPVSHRLIAFAGQRPHTPPPGSLAPITTGFAHTWVLSKTGWQQLRTAVVPTFAPGVLTETPDGGQLLLITTLGQSWAWTGSDWQRYRASNGPPATGVIALVAATDTSRRTVVAVFSTDRAYTTWTLSGHRWTKHRSMP